MSHCQMPSLSCQYCNGKGWTQSNCLVYSRITHLSPTQERIYKFEPKAAYDEIWKSGHFYEKSHNICMVHDEFVE